MKKINREELKKAKDLLRFAKETYFLDISLIIYFLEHYYFAIKENNANANSYIIFYIITALLQDKIDKELQIAKEEVKRLEKYLEASSENMVETKQLESKKR